MATEIARALVKRGHEVHLAACERPFRLDSGRPAIPFKDYAYRELRYRELTETDPRAAAELLVQAQQVVLEKYRQYEELATRGGESFHPAQGRPARPGGAI